MKLWIAIDKNGDTPLLFKRKPRKVKVVDFNNIEWSTGDEADVLELNPEDFPEVTFENSPMEVELKIKTNVRNGK